MKTIEGRKYQGVVEEVRGDHAIKSDETTLYPTDVVYNALGFFKGKKVTVKVTVEIEEVK